jgi:serine/threonine-protein kinase
VALACPTCGDALPDGSRFCPRDGTTVRADTIALTTSAILAIGPAPPPVPADPKLTATDDPLLGRIVDGRYQIRAKLGKGAMGAVYQGEHVGIHKPVAVKILHKATAQTEEFRKRFEREARSASRLSHPGCVSVLDFGHVSRLEPASGGGHLVGIPYLVMELVTGELLSARIEKGKIAPHEAVVIARGVLGALRHAHGLDIVHRDVKPANIALATVGETTPLVKLLDFGLAKSIAVDSPDAQQPLTEMGMIFGTPGYLSPEQAGGNPVDARSDLYSLGVVLFEMVCGRPPFVHDEGHEVVRDHLVTPPPSPREATPALSKEIEAVILKALAKQPSARFQTAEEFQAALAACPEATITKESAPATTTAAAPPPTAAAPAPTAAAPPPTVSRAAMMRRRVAEIWRRHRRTILAATAAAIMLGVVGGLVAARLSSAPPARPSNVVPAGLATVTVPVSPSALRHLRLADEYRQKLWCADAINELERALRDQPELRSSPDLIRTAIPCLRARTQARTIHFLVAEIGPEAQAELEAALDEQLPPDVREGVERALNRLTNK